MKIGSAIIGCGGVTLQIQLPGHVLGECGSVEVLVNAAGTNVPARALAVLQPEDVAACVLLAIHLPPRAIIEELTVRPR